MASRPAQSRAPRLIVSDLDGTFLSPDGTVSDENAAAVLAAQEAGIPVLFATGRPIRWLDVIAHLPGAHPTVIASNGAVLYDLSSEQVVDRVDVDPVVALDAVTAIRKTIPGTAFAFESGLRFGFEPAYQTWRSDVVDDPFVYTGSADEIAHTEPFVKMLVQHASVDADELLARIIDVVGDALTVTHSVTEGHALVEVSGPGVSKASMLRRCCERLGIDPQDVAAFGDMPNDVAMLSWVGMPHVVANAHPSVLALGVSTGRVTVVGPNHESGVGRTIAAWLQ